MATINSRQVIDEIIRGDGWYEGDKSEPRAIKIVRYNNAFDGGIAYGVIFEGDSLDRYKATDFVRNPVTIWEAPLAITKEKE